MKRIALLSLLALITACSRDPGTNVASPSKPSGSAAATDPWQVKAEPPPETLTRPLLWSITKDGKTSYAFGTMHVGIDPDRLPPIVWTKLEASPAFAMETNSADASILGLGQRTAGGTLRDDLGPTYYAKLEGLLGAQMVSNVTKMKPVIAAVMLSMRGLPMGGGGMDMSLQSRAQTTGKPVIYLEAAQKQADLLEKWMDVRALKLMIDTADESLALTKGMVSAYVAGDADKLRTLNDSQKPDSLTHGYTEAEYAQQEAEMLTDRNASWIPAIEAMHAKGGGFIAVGALHLVGNKSVLEMLAAKGYTVTRLTP